MFMNEITLSSFLHGAVNVMNDNNFAVAVKTKANLSVSQMATMR